MEKQNNEPENWTEVYQKIADGQAKNSKELVSELLMDSEKKVDKLSDINRKLIYVIVFLIAALVASNMYWAYQWTSYDYVSQDGEGYNYYNSDVEGDITNGTADQTEEE